jgi:GNAT superfamily N-acetyltransferase
MPEGHIIREATPEDIPELARLFLIAGLVKSGPPDPFTDRQLRNWLNRDVVLPLVACPVEAPKLVVSAAEIHSLGTGARNMAQLEAVATDPAYEGRGLSRAILGRLFWYAQHVWSVNKIIWVSEDVKGRVRARHIYGRLGAKRVEGSNSNFYLKLPYRPSETMRPDFVDHRL